MVIGNIRLVNFKWQRICFCAAFYKENLETDKGNEESKFVSVQAGIEMEKLKAQCSGKKQGIGKIWLKNYALAKKYYEQHGDLNVPGKTKLSRWLSEQRYAKKGKRGGLSPEKIALLEEIGMIWESQRNLTWM